MLDLTAVLNRMNAIQSENPFRVVKCTEEMMKAKTAENGFVYFTTDTHKIYWGQNSSYIPMGGTTGIYYGMRELTDDEKFGDQSLFIFTPEEIEGSSIPVTNDLILNIPDGGFYRVKDSDAYEIETERLAIAGGGGSGGGGGGSSVFTISFHGERDKAFATTTTSMPVSFTCNYRAEDGNKISQITFTKKGEEQPFYIDSQERNFNEVQTIDLAKFSHLFGANRSTVVMMVYDLYGQQKSTNFSIQMVALTLSKVRDNILIARNNKYTYTCKLGGATSGIKNKKLVYQLFNQNNLNSAVLTETHLLNATDIDEISYEFNFASIPHGNYVLRVQALAEPSSSDVPIPSDILTHTLAIYKTSGSAILSVFIPEATEQYTNIPIEYLLVTDEGSQKYTMAVKINDTAKTTLEITANTKDIYDLYFEDQGTYRFELYVNELGIPYYTYLNIVAYTGHLPTINPNRADLMLYLNPRNKSNNATDKNQWADYNGKHTAQLTGLHYGAIDGWMTNENDVNYLKLTSGAQLTLPTFRPFKLDPTLTNVTDSSVGSGLTIELDFTVRGVLDYSAQLFKCISSTRDANPKPIVGFSVTGDKAYFYGGSTQLMSLSLVEGKRTKISFVIEPRTGISYPMVYGYINGKLSGAVMYKTATFEESMDDPATLTISSESAQIDIYGIRFYSSALGDRMILNNYTATLDTLEERQSTYDENDVYDESNLVDYEKVIAEDYDLQIPYMILTGGYATGYNDDKWCRVTDTDKEARLPLGKKDYRMVDVKVHYPDIEYFKDYNDYSFVNIFESGKPMATAYKEAPINGGAIMYAQGTSSMEYPVKNLRLRFNKVKKVVDGEEIKSKENFFTVHPGIAPVEIICMKADYMESSGSHNTGAANFIDDLYKNIGIKTPGQEHFDAANTGSIVTCIKGHPCLIFYSETGAAGTYKYIGKYNLNLDKATPEPFGFDHDDDFGWLNVGDEYYAVEYDDDGDKFIGQVNPDDGGDYDDTKEGEELKTVQDKEKINAIHCFEFLDNAVEVCNFKNKAKAYIKDDATGEMIPDPAGGYYTYAETWYNTFKNKDNEDVPGWSLGFESRYPEERLGYHDADMLYPLASWLNELDTLRSSGDAKDIAEANARFKNEYQCYLNKDFLLTYYLISEALLMADSRVKNMMIATWGKENAYSYYPLSYMETVKYQYVGTFGAATLDPEVTYYKLVEGNYIAVEESDEEDTIIYRQVSEPSWAPDKTKNQEETHYYKFYPIFYDMDTMLGLDNTGKYRFNYYDEDTNASIYNGDEVLWTFVRDSLGDELTTYYSKLEEKLFTAEQILPYFNDNQADMANEAFYNGDSKYKYIDPARNGYHDHLNDKTIEPGAGPYLYAAQGDRSLMREWFLTNRMKFLRGKYNSKKFKDGDRIEYRWYYPKAGALGEEFAGHEETVTAVPPSSEFELKSIKTGYAGVMVGANAGAAHIERFDNVQEKTINATEGQLANGTEAYIVGLSNLSNLGDLSNKYMQKFIIASSDVRLKHLILGNPHKDYYNPYWAVSMDGSKTPDIGINSAIYLETFNLQNCSTYSGELDFSNCSAIQKILLTGSRVSGLTLPVNGILNELRLPSTIPYLNIDSHTLLNDDGFSMGDYDYNGTSRIGEVGGTYTSDYSGLLKIRIIDTPINSYNIVKDANNLQSYYFKNVEWTAKENDAQYCLRPNDDKINIDNIPSYYYYDSNTQTYKLWGNPDYPTDKLLYEKVDMLDEDNNLINIPVLDYLASRGTIDNVPHADALSGTLTVDISGIKVDEYAIYLKYIAMYPDLKIKYKNATVSAAYNIAFHTMEYSDSIDVDKVTPYFEVKTADSAEKTLAQLIENPKFTMPLKGSTNTETFAFTGLWYDYDSNAYYYQDDYFPGGYERGEHEDWPEGATAFSAYTPGADMRLFPLFISSTRKYIITFYNYNYPEEGSQVMRLEGEYEQTVANLLNTDDTLVAKSNFCYRPDEPSFVTTTQRYALRGWQSETDFNNKVKSPSLYDLSTLKIYSDLNLFAHYEVEDATKVATNSVCFTLDEDQLIVKTEYKDLLIGRITIPSKIDNQYITAIGTEAFQNMSKITEVFFLEDTHYNTIGSYAFDGCIKLTNAHLPNTITVIRNEAFQDCVALQLSQLPENLEDLGARAFSRCGTSIAINSLPPSLKYLQNYAFNGCPCIDIRNIHDGIKLSQNALRYCGQAIEVDQETTITVNISATSIDEAQGKIGQDAFESYMNNKPKFKFQNMSYTNIVNTLFDDWGLKDTQVQDQT